MRYWELVLAVSGKINIISIKTLLGISLEKLRT